MLASLPRFPCALDKSPLTPHGHHDAVANPIGEYRWPLTGVPAGEGSGIFVLDIDRKNGGDHWLAANRPRLTPTFRYLTQSGGEHWIYQYADGVRGSRGRIASGIDVISDGSPGYFIFWPRSGLPVLTEPPVRPIREAPDWLVEAAKGGRNDNMATCHNPLEAGSHVVVLKQTVPDFSREASFAWAAMRNAERAVMSAPKGIRNDTLNSKLDPPCSRPQAHFPSVYACARARVLRRR
jgi:Bifunctional DNA primase/polymerase, N-terminal